MKKRTRQEQGLSSKQYRKAETTYWDIVQSVAESHRVRPDQKTPLSYLSPMSVEELFKQPLVDAGAAGAMISRAWRMFEDVDMRSHGMALRRQLLDEVKWCLR